MLDTWQSKFNEMEHLNIIMVKELWSQRIAHVFAKLNLIVNLSISEVEIYLSYRITIYFFYPNISHSEAGSNLNLVQK